MTLDPNHSYGSIRGATIGKSNRQDLVLINTPGWMDQAACVGHDPEWWHRRHGEWAQKTPNARLTGGPADDQIKAERICATCPVRKQCLTHGQDTKSSGLFGGQWLTGQETPCSNQ